MALPADPVRGFSAPVHRALIEPILLAGAPRAVAIANGTLAAAIGLGLRLWVAGVLIWLVGHLAAVRAARRDAQFVEVVRRHLRYPACPRCRCTSTRCWPTSRWWAALRRGSATRICASSPSSAFRAPPSPESSTS
jgi:type IV secretion system protein VirB3